jgi:hypothetical protein
MIIMKPTIGLPERITSFPLDRTVYPQTVASSTATTILGYNFNNASASDGNYVNDLPPAYTTGNAHLDIFQGVSGNSGIALDFPAFDSHHQKLQPTVNRVAKKVKSNDHLGIEGNNTTGTIPVITYNSDETLGVTTYDGKDIVSYVGINERVVNNPEITESVLEHELYHVDSADLLNYTDVPEELARITMEMYAEMRRMFNNPEDRKEIFMNSPYKEEILIGAQIDAIYHNETTGRQGFRGFMSDMEKEASMAYAWENFKQNLQENTSDLTESLYRLETLPTAA